MNNGWDHVSLISDLLTLLAFTAHDETFQTFLLCVFAYWKQSNVGGKTSGNKVNLS